MPVGKLREDRYLPLHPHLVALIDDYRARYVDPASPLLLPRENGKPADRHAVTRYINKAGAAAGLPHIHPHQLRHTLATQANGGIALPALMALMGHVTPEMTLRYAKLASPAIRAAYQDAMDKIRARQPLPIVAIGGAPVIPDRVEWLHAEMLKTRLAHGYCSRHPAAGRCPYANICEQCENFVPDPGAADVITRQLDDIKALHADAQARGWDDEAARHHRVARNLQQHLNSLS